MLCTLSSSYNPVAQAPLDIKAVRDGPTSILVSWRNPSHSEDTNGYIINYSSGGSNASVTIYEVDTEYTLRNLLNGGIYFITVRATSEHFNSDSVSLPTAIHLGKNSTQNFRDYCFILMKFQISLRSFWRALQLTV